MRTLTRVLGTLGAALLLLSGTAAFAQQPVNTELPTASTTADGISNPSVPGVRVYLYCWNGTTWDRCPGSTAGVTVNTELPAAAAAADATSNPTAPAVLSFQMCWNGSTWDRCVIATDATRGSAALDDGPQMMCKGASSTPSAESANDAVPVWCSTSGAVNMICTSGCGGSGGTSLADDGDVTPGTTDGSPIIGVYEASPTNCTGGDGCIVGITQKRAMRVSLEASDGTALTPATDATHDSPASTTGPQLMCYGKDTAPTQVSADGDATRVYCDRYGQIGVKGLDNIEGGIGGVGDSAATAGSSGSVNAKLRLLTSQEDAVKTAVEALATYLQPATQVRIKSDNTNNDDETQIKSTAGVLLYISGFNSSTSANAYVRCTNATAASTTPGSTTVFFEMLLPFGGGAVHSNLGPSGMTFGTALTCYIATGAADSDATDAPQNEVVVNVGYR